MKANLFRCANPEQTNQIALRYLFANAKDNEELKVIANSLIQAITGFDPALKEPKIDRIWPAPFGDVGLNVEICYGNDRYHLSFFFFEYGKEDDIEAGMLKSTSCIRGDHHAKGCFLIHYRPEDSTKAKFHGWKENLDGGSELVHANGELLFGAMKQAKCADPIIAEYIDYLNSIHHEMTTKDWGAIWLNGPVGFENYVENYLRPLFVNRYGDKVSLDFSRSGWNVGSINITIDTGFDLHDPRGESVDSWIILEFQIEFPNPVATVRVFGDCFCFIDPENWIYEENMDEAFYRMRKALDQGGSLFLPKGGKAEPKSLVGEYKPEMIYLKNRDAWSTTFPSTTFELVDNLFKLFGYKPA